MPDRTISHNTRSYNRFLLMVAGLGGLLYGVDVGIIGGALPYLEATSKLTPGQLSIIVAAVLLGSVFSTLFAGMLADWLGRKPLLAVSGAIFVASIPAIALSQSYGALFSGRLLQGISGGFVGVVVPLYLAECLPAKDRGKGTGVFQWLLTLGIVSAAIIGIYYSYKVEAISHYATPQQLFDMKNTAWRRIFWMSMPPGVLFFLGSLFVAESPRLLYKRGHRERAYAALLRSYDEEQAKHEIEEMDQIALTTKSTRGEFSATDSLLSRKYVIPFLLACVILFCNTATGINSIIGYNTDILLQSGLSDVRSHWGYVLFTFLNFLMTIIGMVLVDRKGRKFLFLLGTSGMIVALLFVGVLFRKTEAQRVDVRDSIQRMVNDNQQVAVPFNISVARQLLNAHGVSPSGTVTLSVIYSYGDFTTTTSTVRSDDSGGAALQVNRASCVPSGSVEAFFRNPFANFKAARTAPLHIDHAYISPIPDIDHGLLVALGLYLFITFYALGPGVCVWLALSELMPTRIRSNGMSVALVLNQLASTTLAAIFLPIVGKYGYSTMFFLFTFFALIYLGTVAFFLPETKGKTLEEIEEYFRGA